MSVVLALEAVTKRFGAVVAVDGVSLSVREGEFFALLGPSGCGKTTILRLLAGFETPDEGRILLDGRDIARDPPNRRPLNLMFQSYALFPHMSVRANVAYGLEMERLGKDEIRDRVAAILATVGLTDLAERRPAQLSGGQRQRVALARALVKRPRVLLLDEPLGALDKKLRESMQLELKKLQHEIGVAYVMVTHDQEEALVMADRVAVLKDGRLLQCDTPHEVYERPTSRFVAGFIGMMNFLPGRACADGVWPEGGAPIRAAGPPAAEARSAVAAVRPERLTPTPGPTQTNRLEGVVEAVAYHGLDQNLHLRVAGVPQPVLARLTADAAERRRPRVGERLTLGFAPADTLLFDDAAETAPPPDPAPSPALRRPAMTGKTVAFFPEAAYGPALNSVGIAQAMAARGHKAVFLSDPGFVDVYKGYGFEAHPVNLSEPMPPEVMAQFWVDFINGHIPNFGKSPYDQIDNYVKDCWTAIVDTAKWAQKDLPGVLAAVKPDMICVDNVILFPAIKQYGKPWVRIISCSENEIEDPAIPPHLSGCGATDAACHARYRARFEEVIAPIHADFNAFLASCGEAAYPLGQFFEASPFMNLLLYPEPVKFTRAHPLEPARFQYLEGCVRREKPYVVPAFGVHADKPLIYVSFGSLGSGDVALLKRLIAALGRMPLRALVNVGGYIDQYTEALPPNVVIDKWFPQPSVIAQVNAVIHHGGNNSFTECLYFGKGAIIMPYVWDGHDNATRVEETGHGFKLHRYDWTDADLSARLSACLYDPTMRARLAATSAHMQAQSGPEKAARVLSAILEHGRYDA